ncbi:hypothetical protein K504DRAFT_502898 [Pleomassaria siparia CBS 279.74]|uniref:Glucose receptor Git3-like N-terminal domain-containing protein n=1 Tax=Pleomassaria siparia CBS 279.74 TaxID=1314801 RepID=A0A6G1K945_9PLEO|nr:hypothetical protein K504DRAFT_502898 [Pleomassaria siparia CBS 279.74]
MATSFIAFYWFCQMERRFRHRLIMLLIYGDLIMASWLFIFALISIARGTYGMETSDFAVLVIAVHSAIQVFRPSLLSSSNVLYPWRHSSFLSSWLAWLLLILIGATCLKAHSARCLSDRSGLAVAIYTHVGFEFRSFSQVGQSVKPSLSTITPMTSGCEMEEGTTGGAQRD